MPKQTRWAIKQGLDCAVNGLERAEQHLITEGKRFEGHASDMWDKFCLLVQAIDKIKSAVIQLRESI